MERADVFLSLLRQKKNSETKIENDKNEFNSFTFSPKISQESTKLSKNHDLFKIRNFYERNIKWKENANNLIQNELVFIFV